MNYITRPHVNIFYYIIATSKLDIKYFNESDFFSEISSALCIYISVMKKILEWKTKDATNTKGKRRTTKPYPQVTIRHLLKTVVLSG